MTEIFLIILLILQLIIIALLFFSKSKSQAHNNLEALDKIQEKQEKSMRDEMSRNRVEMQANTKQIRDEVNNSFKSFGDSIDKRIFDLSKIQSHNFELFSKNLSELTQQNEIKFDKIKETLEYKLESLQKDNSEKLEKMRATVDEKLNETLDKRLGEKFKIVSERLEMVHRGLGEMQTLASGVGDLKKVLTNVKTRGTWGEVQLGSLLDQILNPEQYEKNVVTKHASADRVEFAIKLPGKDDELKQVWLPIDSKFPIEDYQRLIEAQEKADTASIEFLNKALETRIKSEAKDIKNKYIDPPYTTDFAILYLPIEGLYAEIAQKTMLCTQLQREYRVNIAGPNTIAAMLNALQMGFKTLAIEKRSSDVWKLLGAIKTDFSKFGDLLDKTSKKLQEAGNVIEDAASKTRVIQKKLEKVEEMPGSKPISIENTTGMF